MSKGKVTRSNDNIFLIGHPCDTISGARLPSGRDVMRNFIFYHRSEKLSINESANCVYDQLLPFWNKCRLPVRQKNHIIKKIRDLYGEQVNLMKHKKRNNPTDQANQSRYTEKIDKLFDISHANSNQLIKIEEDREFLKMQQESRTGTIGTLDKKLSEKEKRSAERLERHKLFLKRSVTAVETNAETHNQSSSEESEFEDNLSILSSTSSNNSSASDKVEDFGTEPKTPRNPRKRRKNLISPSISAVLDRTNTSIRKSTMILASVVNEAGCSTSSVPLSKSTVHRHRQRRREEAAKEIKANYNTTKSVVHWDGKMLPDVSGKLVDRLPVLVSSLVDGTIKLLGVPPLTSGSGKAAADAVVDHLKLWKCDSLVVGMCFDTTASNTGRLNGACSLLEVTLGRDLLWMACRHHMFEVLLADAYKVCLGPSSGPEILIFKRFRETWTELKHHSPVERTTPRLSVTDALKSFISNQISANHPREDYQEFLNLAAIMVGLDIVVAIRKPGALHRARWMAKAIYSLKMELLFDGNENVMKLTPYEFQGLQRFNRFVILIYVQSWFTSRSAVDAPINDIYLIQRLEEFDDENLRNTGLKMMQRHSWYLSQELATVALFSKLLTADEKTHLVATMTPERGTHLIKILPQNISDLRISSKFFSTIGIDDSFLNLPVDTWPQCQSYNDASHFVHNLACINDCAERGVALMQTFNMTTKDEIQKQYLLQVVEEHRKNFISGNRDELLKM